MIRRPNPSTLIASPTDVVDLGGRVAGATFIVGAKSGNTRPIAVQLVDGQGKDIAARAAVQIAVLADANGDAFAATGGSTGIAVGTDGALLPIVAKKLFMAISEADGDIDLTWTDTASEVAYLAVIVGGKLSISAALTN
ncbi:hypothetical protein [Sphingomonas sp. MMS24-J13]|uniref:hypothetical protein n=1 Tax=Sphingomonas sp. MMS24-J13 TaxID=3238686 RepID=UPI00384EBC5D